MRIPKNLHSFYIFGLVLAIPTAVTGQSTNWLIPNKEVRLKLAEDLLKNFESLESQIPTLSPSEEEWLNTEIDETMKKEGGQYTKRALSAMESREYSIRVARSNLAIINMSLRLISSNLSIRDDKQEAKYWLWLSTELIDHEFWQALYDLNERNIINLKNIFKERFPSSFNLEVLYQHWVTQSQFIMSGIVLQYMISDSLRQ